MNDERLIDAHELSRRLGLPRTTIYRMVAKGSLPHYRTGPSRHGVRFRVAEVLAALRAVPADEVSPRRMLTPA